MVTCPFCDLSPERTLYEGRSIKALWDAFPVSPGHVLLIPKRHVANWFDADLEEQEELTAGIAIVREIIEEVHSPDGYNIGMNIGQSAGQTVLHLHVHVIPRYQGDVPDPRGGVRYVVPQQANYQRS